MLIEIAKLAAGLLDNLREAAHILLIRALRLEVREPARNIRLTIGAVRRLRGSLLEICERRRRELLGAAVHGGFCFIVGGAQ